MVYEYDSGLINAILFVDLKKAFDTIDHEILLGKWNRYGFSNQTVELFRNYLSGRTQITVINNVSSGSREITCSVPQGSILGPLLFLLYINDLPKCLLISNGRLFADDTNLTYADNGLNKITSDLNDDLKILQNWLNMNKLSPLNYTGPFTRGTFHVPNLMQMSSNKELRSLTLGSAHKKFDV